MLALLTQSLITNVIQAEQKQQYDEPDVRPDIRDDAVWDSYLGMYVSPDLTKDENGEYAINNEVFIDLGEIDFGDEWLKEHSDSDNIIDKAILLSREYCSEYYESNPLAGLYSSQDPHIDECILKAMRMVPVEDYPELWRRVCEERAFRYQKMLFLEKVIGIDLKLGFADQWAQHRWYELFTELKSNIKNLSGIITEDQVDQYGTLLLPNLQNKVKNECADEKEIAVMNAIVQKLNEWASPEKGPEKIETYEDMARWFDKNANIVDSIRAIISDDYPWAYVVENMY